MAFKGSVLVAVVVVVAAIVSAQTPPYQGQLLLQRTGYVQKTVLTDTICSWY